MRDRDRPSLSANTRRTTTTAFRETLAGQLVRLPTIDELASALGAGRDAVQEALADASLSLEPPGGSAAESLMADVHSPSILSSQPKASTCCTPHHRRDTPARYKSRHTDVPPPRCRIRVPTAQQNRDCDRAFPSCKLRVSARPHEGRFAPGLPEACHPEGWSGLRMRCGPPY